MSTARHHAEWLSLLETSGPFLSMPVLLRAFPQGLDAHDSGLAREVRLAHGEWQESQGGRRPDPAIHTAWVRFVLERALELPEAVIAEGQAVPASLKAVFAEHGETLRPELAVLNPSRNGAEGTGAGVGAARLLLQVYPPEQDLEKPVAGRRWKASPATRMMELLHACDARLGLVTNGEHWMLVDAPRGETTGFISWYSEIWLEEPITLRAFRSLLGARRFFGVPDDETLEALLAASASDQQEVTDQLGRQVRRAVEVFVQAIDRADQDRGRELLGDEVTPERLYEAALTVMMRLVFLLSAEERGLLLLGDPLYDQHYAVSTLRAQLREAADQFGEEVLAYRMDAWPRLLATFRAVHGGVQHENMRLLAYGGSLFDPDRFPFLEGRPHPQPLPLRFAPGTMVSHGERGVSPLPINNRVVLHMLEALQILQVKVPGGGPAEARRLSFRALDIEQIGHVYEGLLDHTAARANGPVLGLTGTKGKEPEVALDELETLADGNPASQDPNPRLIDFLKDQTGRSLPALRNGLTREPSLDMSRLLAACGNDQALYQRILPFAGLIRVDDFEQPTVILPGSVYVTAGQERRRTGTHYTPRSLTEPIVQHTLEPLVYEGPAEGWPKEKWKLRSPAELLDLKVCDMAMGSAGFLVQACRYLAERLVEAWEIAEAEIPNPNAESPISDSQSPAVRPRITPEGKPSTGAPGETLIPVDADERIAFARRIVADRCLYGVDKNPLAVEMAKLSLWLITLAKDKPFTFLDHALKCGDSLVGADEDMFLRWAHGLKDSAATLFDEQIREQLQAAREKRRVLEALEVKDVRDIERKQSLLAEADAALARVKLGCDLLIGVRLLGLKGKELEARLHILLMEYVAQETPNSREAEEALAAGRGVRAFHWPFVFPEVFERGGFSAFVSNPPFLGGQRISTMMGDDYFRYLRSAYPSSTGTADLCAFFFLRAFQHLRPIGTLGLIATNTIAQGDTRLTGLDNIVKSGGAIYAASPSVPWPGVAAVIVSVVHLSKGQYKGEKWLDSRSVVHISPLLDSMQEFGQPNRLAANADQSFIGSYVLGMGFVLEPEEAQALIARVPRNQDVLFPYLNGEDLNSRPDQSPSRWAINFFDWPLERTASGSWLDSTVEQQTQWLRSGTVPEDYPEPVAADYPECLDIVRRLVKPHRDTVNRERNRERWWIYAENRPGLYRTISLLNRVMVRARVTKTHAPIYLATGIVFSDATVVIALEDDASYSVVQSSIHELWAWQFGSTLKTDLRYTPSDVFETFPFPNAAPAHKERLQIIAVRYHRHRDQLLLARQEGLTPIYNRFNDPAETSSDIARLRELHVDMDNAVAQAYGWGDLDLGHDFHETPQGARFTISESARREVLARLLRLNHERYEEEVAMELHVKKGKKGKRAGGKAGSGAGRRKKPSQDTPRLL